MQYVVKRILLTNANLGKKHCEREQKFFSLEIFTKKTELEIISHLSLKFTQPLENHMVHVVVFLIWRNLKEERGDLFVNVHVEIHMILVIPLTVVDKTKKQPY